MFSCGVDGSDNYSRSNDQISYQRSHSFSSSQNSDKKRHNKRRRDDDHYSASFSYSLPDHVTQNDQRSEKSMASASTGRYSDTKTDASKKQASIASIEIIDRKHTSKIKDLSTQDKFDAISEKEEESAYSSRYRDKVGSPARDDFSEISAHSFI
uniref:Uncharacterized protein n=1 Tax=Leptocylindrus danicus TaxID=163516 RepID=A0A7S2LAX4_9STRA|mmetsp:Transcript_33611/g.48676  ORF Transcript_33611/g.48676 Transcript_33611/m.48676 type:complete len:154 (+) Transcript_33611:1-462(+)